MRDLAMDATAGTLLLLDTCGEPAVAGLAVAGAVTDAEALSPRGASAELVAAVRRLLGRAGLPLAALRGIGVVAGPGSFTGVRVGMAAAKGLCEATGLPLAAISRLEALTEAAGGGAVLAALHAGRGEVYLRDAATGREWLSPVSEALLAAAGREVVVAEAAVAEALAEAGPRSIALGLAEFLPLVERALAHGGADARAVDANYVRAGADLYARRQTA